MYQEKNFFPILVVVVVVVVKQRGERGGDHTGCGRPCRPGAPAQRVHKVQKAPQGVLRYDSMVSPCLGILGSKTTKKKGLKLGVRMGCFWGVHFLIPPYHIDRRQGSRTEWRLHEISGRDGNVVSEEDLRRF